MERNSQSLGRRCVWLGMAVFAIMLADYNALVAQAPGTVVAADKRVKGRDYVFAETGETLPYALFVPSNYDAAKKWPLIVGLHGAGRPYDWLMGYDGMIDFAERDGFILVTAARPDARRRQRCRRAGARIRHGRWPRKSRTCPPTSVSSARRTS